MSRIYNDLKVGLDEELEDRLQWLLPGYSSFHILKKSLDARRAHAPHFVYSVEVFAADEKPALETFDLEPIAFKGDPVLIIGSGPAGLFAALRLVERGIPCHLFEQGSETPQRLKAITRFWRYGELNLRNNVGFGEGGAGLYSDGKLITRIRSPHIPYVMQRLVRFGAPAEIQYLSNPHVGSDRIRRVIPVMREYLKSHGCQIHFDTKVSKLLVKNGEIEGLQTESGEEFKSSRVILACGHSAEDFFDHLSELGVYMEGKSFAVGLRIEHPQSVINEIQYRKFSEHPKLDAANYKLAYTDKTTNVGVYSFCMCPGGYVLSSSTDHGGVVSNGMSNYNRNSPFANAAIVVTVDYEQSFGKDLFAGLKFRKQIEAQAQKMAVAAGGPKQMPVQKLSDFMSGRLGEALKSSCPSGVLPARLDQLFSPDFKNNIMAGIEKFERNMKGFISDQAQFHGVESRTSCPLRITRDAETLQSVSHRGLYPAGEGAGYAGGITSAACDGITIAEAIVAELHSQPASQLAHHSKGLLGQQ